MGRSGVANRHPLDNNSALLGNPTRDKTPRVNPRRPCLAAGHLRETDGKSDVARVRLWDTQRTQSTAPSEPGWCAHFIMVCALRCCRWLFGRAEVALGTT
eukprot:1177066-Prorocentrum_minimum.AAC.2